MVRRLTNISNKGMIAALRRVVAKSICSDKKERPPQKISCVIQPGLTYKNPAVKEVRLKPSAKGAFTDFLEACN